MTITPRSSKAQKEEVANLGVFRPPLIYLTSIVVGLAFQWLWPRPVLSGVAPGPLGALLVVMAILGFAASVQRFRTAGTPVPARKPTTAIVRTGPYRFSRNPIYLAFSLLQLGIALWVNSWWLVATLAAGRHHPLCRRPEGRTVSRGEIRCRVPALQGVGASLVVTIRFTKSGSDSLTGSNPVGATTALPMLPLAISRLTHRHDEPGVVCEPLLRQYPGVDSRGDVAETRRRSGRVSPPGFRIRRIESNLSGCGGCN
jgi:hypothetical protein